jgi:cytochrome d ubiquinol oxidase subunit II
METVWFVIVAVMIAAYVVLDGFDLGAGIIYLLVGKTNEDRRKVQRSIGPVWDGNEVWLLAAGGTLYFAYPQLYASAFSGFYRPLMMVLWLLMLRGIGIELRAHMENRVWLGFFDAVFCDSSATGDLLRGRLGERDPGCASGRGPLLFRAAVDKFPAGAAPRDS